MLIYAFAHNYLDISAMRDKHDLNFENKSNTKFCIVFDSQGIQKMHFHWSSFGGTISD